MEKMLLSLFTSLQCCVALFFYLHSGVDILTVKDQISFLHHVNLVTKKRKEESIEKKKVWKWQSPPVPMALTTGWK